MSHTFQFKATRTTGISYPTERAIQAVDIAGTICTSAAGGSPAVFNCLMSAFRIKRLRIWQPYRTLDQDSGALLANVCGVLWEGDGTAAYAPVWRQATALNLSQSALLDLRPPRNSQAAFWTFPSSSEMFRLQFDQDAIILIDVEFNIFQSNQPNGVPTVTVGSPANTINPGFVYRLPLDNATGGAICLFPVDAWIQVVTP